MTFRAIIGLLVLLAATHAQAQNCDLKLVTRVDMLPLENRMEVPVSINGIPKLLLLDTGGVVSQLSPDAVKDLKLAFHETGGRIYDASGIYSHGMVIANNLTLGALTAKSLHLMISPENLGVSDGLLSSDLLVRYDVDVDFGTGKLSYFSPDHCPGKVVYWHTETVAEVPLTLREGSKFLVEVRLDGKPFNALVDTGATRSFISMPVAREIFGLTQDSPGMTPAGDVNGDPRLFSYLYKFSNLTFEGVTVSNPAILLIPDRLAGSTIEAGSYVASAGVKLPELVLGMDVMKHLHMYFAFNEKKLYVSAAAPAPPEVVVPGQSQSLTMLDKAITLSPENATLLDERCFRRGIENIKLDGALVDCEASLRSSPAYPNPRGSKGLVLYRLGRYQEALDIYNSVLSKYPKFAASLYMRGQTKRKLGDATGAAADITAAKALQADVNKVFNNAGIAD
ncbi:MAG TPA: aspartyl protease family protein [Rhizomicrobium sp.]|nr:aspartyl protease family protein [Rhizomicrobium sp.]